MVDLVDEIQAGRREAAVEVLIEAGPILSNATPSIVGGATGLSVS
jgi:hypothetical protein